MVYNSEKQKRLNSIQSCDPICKPTNLLDKSTQRGRPLVVSRSHPDFCVFCGTRHSSISCEAVDPVHQDHDVPTSSQTTSLPPSKCRDCTSLDHSTTITIVDGVQQTVTTSKIRLCTSNLLPDTICLKSV